MSQGLLLHIIIVSMISRLWVLSSYVCTRDWSRAGSCSLETPRETSRLESMLSLPGRLCGMIHRRNSAGWYSDDPMDPCSRAYDHESCAISVGLPLSRLDRLHRYDGFLSGGFDTFKTITVASVRLQENNLRCRGRGLCGILSSKH